MRPKFFPASVLPVLAGSAWGFMVAGQFDFFVFILALLATVCVHAGANVLNDVGDDSGGTDRQNEDRIYPYTGGSRFIQAGIMTAGAMSRLGVSLLAVAAVAGLILLVSKGTMVLWFGIAGISLAVLYSLGPVRLASIGLGELAVGIAFGVLPVTGAAWLQSGSLGLDVLLFSIPVSACCVGLARAAT
jgi:1,4-dihydroxy-2-naphthoate octaprenyltransferase